MTNKKHNGSYSLNIVIVKHGLGSKVLAIAKRCGISGGTVLMGRGTVKNAILSFFEISEYRKEIALVLSNEEDGRCFLEKVYIQLKLNKANSGIAFSIPIQSVFGTRGLEALEENTSKDADEVIKVYDSITVIVDKGNANQVVEVANGAGAKGATIVNGRGSGIHETNKLFAFEIEPEKEVVIILVEHSMTRAICQSIKEEMKLDEPGKGIMYVQEVSEVYGVK